MPLLHEETLARYQELRPSQFMQCVIFGDLRDQMHTVYTVVNVYTRIMLSLPATEDLRLTYVPNTIMQFPVELRDIMRNIQRGAVDAYNLLQRDNRLLAGSKGADILQVVDEISQPIELIDRWAAAIEGDLAMKGWIVPELRSKTPAQVAGEIRQYIFDTHQVLLFAQAYAIRWNRRSRQMS
ncbi:MAG: hypothetical protein H0X30_28920 [Anaerolineae bacterium]|nr:hypothetical protein [Anaerolineae bacterium]